MRKKFISTLILILAFSFSGSFSSAQAQNLEPSFFLRPPAEVAQDLFQTLFTLSPEDRENMLYAGLSHLEKGQRPRAEDLFGRALKASPKNYKIPLKIGTAYLKEGELQKSEEMI